MTNSFDIMIRRRTLNAAAQRWGAKDLFPDKWVRFTGLKGTQTPTL
jgi:hypothetical protein